MTNLHWPPGWQPLARAMAEVRYRAGSVATSTAGRLSGSHRRGTRRQDCRMHDVNASDSKSVLGGVPRIAWALFLSALLLRLWGAWYGLPYLYISDEYHEVMRALQLGTGSFNFDRIGKGGFYFVLFVEYGVYFLLLKLTGVVASAEDFARMFARDPSAFYWMGRATAALIGALTVAVAFQLGRRAYSTTAGVLAAAFLAFNVLHVDLSRRIGVDVPMTLLTLTALYFATANPRFRTAPRLSARSALCGIGYHDQADGDSGAAAVVAGAHVSRGRSAWRHPWLVEFAQFLACRHCLRRRAGCHQSRNRRCTRFLQALHRFLRSGRS